jgi:hypothetical protein
MSQSNSSKAIHLSKETKKKLFNPQISNNRIFEHFPGLQAIYQQKHLRKEPRNPLFDKVVNRQSIRTKS